MSTVRVKANHQVTLPAAIIEKVGLKAGDLLDARIEKGKITLTPRSEIDQRIAESIADYEAGRSYGPFDTANELIASLENNLNKRVARKNGKRLLTPRNGETFEKSLKKRPAR